ncbi:MAG: sugar transporter [Parachlamydiales bacterium]
MCKVEEFVRDSSKINEGKFAILEMYGNNLAKLDAKLLEDRKDLIEEEDILNIEIYHPIRKDLTNLIKSLSQTSGFQIIDKNIYLPGFGYIKVENLTLNEAKEEIQKKCLKEISDIEVFVSFKKRKLKKIEVTGLVSDEISIESNTRIYELFSKIKLPRDANLFKSYVLREGVFLPVDMYKLIKQGDMSQNIVLNDHDKIYIADAPSSKIYVLGEVQKQLAIDIPDGKISLKEALTISGGILYTGDKSFIQIFRANVKTPKIYLLNWDYITQLPSSSLNLIDGDIVYVASKPLADWNRFVMQILPTISIIDSAYRGFKNMGIMIDGK